MKADEVTGRGETEAPRCAQEYRMQLLLPSKKESVSAEEKVPL